MLQFCILVILLAAPILGASLPGRVVGGVDADFGDVPSIVSIRNENGHSCGGVLISEDYVLTAGHCSDYSTSIQYGVIEVDSNVIDETVIPIESKIVHENFSLALENDIALFKLSKPAIFGKYVKPAVLPDEDEPAPSESNVLLAGWGYNATGGIMPKRLQKVNLTIVDLEECRDMHANANYSLTVFDSMLCAGSPGGEKEQCSGDSGGPLTLNGKVVGLVSWSRKPCGLPPYPGVYTRVASFRKWIRKHSGV